MANPTVGSAITEGLGQELIDMEGLKYQNMDSGKFEKRGTKSVLDKYTTRLFGAPYQLLDSVDKRFPSINSHVGNDYLRNFLLNAPIISIRPGLPKYTGNTSDNFFDTLGQIFRDSFGGVDAEGNATDASFGGVMYNILMQGIKNGPMKYGEKLEKRFFDFRETYTDYCHYANYMCRSVANFLKLTSTNDYYPNGTFVSEDSWETFDKIRWENYRFRNDSKVESNAEYFANLATAGGFGAIKDWVTGESSDLEKYYRDGSNFSTNREVDDTEGTEEDAGDEVTGDSAETNNNSFSFSDLLELTGSSIKATAAQIFNSGENAKYGSSGLQSAYDYKASKITCVQFMVEPADFSETYTNNTRPSLVESAVDGIQQNVGSEIQWITQSDTDGSIIDGFLNTTGTAVESVLSTIGNMSSNLAGGFVSNLFSGAIRSLKGQKMIYPNIYQNSQSTNNYQFTINLRTPYGDVYNYYMNIVVPWLHLLALTAPRMVTANSLSSPFIVQAYIPGMATIQMGIIRELTFSRNPEQKFVSNNGFPNSAKVTIGIDELYNAMAISAANDPASFLYNETLNDYMCNLAGIVPSMEASDMQRQNGFAQMSQYFTSGGIGNDLINMGTELIEDWIDPV